MADVLVKPAFQSAVVDSGDGTKLGPTAWNAARLFTGGNDGEVCVRSAASATGAAWSASPTLTGTLSLRGTEYEVGTDAAIFVDLTGSATSGVLRGVHARTTHNDNAGSAGSASTAMWGEAVYSGAMALNHIVGVEAYATHKGTGALNALYGLNAWPDTQGLGTLGTLFGLNIFAPNTGVGTTTAYGIFINDFAAAQADGNGYAIFTGTGRVRFGGALTVNARSAFTVDDQNLSLDTPAGTQTAALVFKSAGVSKWQMQKPTDDSWSLYSYASGSIVLSVNASGNAVATTKTFSCGALTATSITGPLSTAAQPAITSVGTLSTLTVTGAIGTGGNITGASLSAAAGSSIFWVGRTILQCPANGQLLIVNQTPVGVGFDINTDAVLKIRTRAQSAYAQVDALGYSVGGVAGASKTAGPVTSITVVNGIVTACT